MITATSQEQYPQFTPEQWRDIENDAMFAGITLEDAIQEYLQIQQMELEDRRKRRLDDCGTFTTFFDLNMGKPRASSSTCKIWRECDNCFRLRVGHAREMVARLLQKFSTLYWGIVPYDDEAAFKRRLHKEEYMRFPTKNGVVFILSTCADGFQKMVKTDDFLEEISWWMETPERMSPSFGMYNYWVKDNTVKEGFKIKTPLYNAGDSVSADRLRQELDFIALSVETELFRELVDVSHITPEHLGDLVNEIYLKELTIRGIDVKKGYDLWQTIEPDGPFLEKLSNRGVSVSINAQNNIETKQTKVQQYAGVFGCFAMFIASIPPP